MTLHYLAIILSIAGAVLFFLSGFICQYLISTKKNQTQSTHDSDIQLISDFPVSSEKKERVLKRRLKAVCLERNILSEKRKSIKEKAEKQIEKTKHYINIAKKKVASVEGEIGRKDLYIEELSRTITDLKNDFKVENEELKVDIKKLQQEKDKLLNEIELLKNSTSERNAFNELQENNKKTHEELDVIQNEKAVLINQLNTAMEELELMTKQQDDLAELKNANSELLIQIEVFKEQLTELQALKDENRELKSIAEEMNSLKDEMNELKNENAKLVSRGIALNPPPEPVVSDTSKGLGVIFQLVANELAQNQDSRGVVVADELGFLIAGTGEHVDAMAGMAGVFSDMCTKANSILPLDDINLIKISTIQDLTVTMMPFAINSDKVIVNVLSVGKGLDKEQVKEVIDNQAS